MDHPTRTLAERVLREGLIETSVLSSLGLEDTPAAPDGYELRELLGRGGGGRVYLARDLNLDRPVALKFLSNAGSADLERFRREARFAARIENPSIVKIYELGEVGGQLYIAMQYVAGGSLTQQRVDPVEAARIARDVARALEQAHREGIVHRDIKPANILVDTDGRVYVTDFGIARDLRGRAGETMSREGQIMGTPGLMPPEQARGDVHTVDARSDVYALGATLYRIVTGRDPFVAPNLVELLHAVIHEPLVLPRTHNPAVPRDLEEVIVKCMAKRREARYASMGELATALDRFVATPTKGGGSSAWFHRLVGVPTESAPSTYDDADPHGSEGLDLVRALTAWDSELYRVSGSLAPSFARLDAIRARLEAILVNHPDAGWARFYRGLALFRRGRLGEALEEMEGSVDRVADAAGAFFELGRLYLALYFKEQRVARKHLSIVGIRDDLGVVRGRLDQAAVAFEEMRRAGGDHASWHQAYARAASCFAEGDPDGCVAICVEILETEPDREEVWRLRGDAELVAGRDPHASYDQALAVRRSDHETLLAKAEAYRTAGATEDARVTLERAQSIHPEHAELAALLARTYLDEGAAGDAGDDTTLVTARELALLAHRLDPTSYEATVTLAEAHLAAGRRGDAPEAFDAALDILGEAQALPGCQNRVKLLIGWSRFERARSAPAGADHRAEIVAVASECRAMRDMVPDHGPWRELGDAVDQWIGAG